MSSVQKIRLEIDYRQLNLKTADSQAIGVKWNGAFMLGPITMASVRSFQCSIRSLFNLRSASVAGNPSVSWTLYLIPRSCTAPLHLIPSSLQSNHHLLQKCPSATNFPDQWLRMRALDSSRVTTKYLRYATTRDLLSFAQDHFKHESSVNDRTD